eukprot:6197036-Pleurochrysis_carterae.AAC.4
MIETVPVYLYRKKRVVSGTGMRPARLIIAHDGFLADVVSVPRCGRRRHGGRRARLAVHRALHHLQHTYFDPGVPVACACADVRASPAATLACGEQTCGDGSFTALFMAEASA